MTALLAAVALGLLACVLLLLRERARRERELRYIAQRLERLEVEGQGGQVLLFTSDPAVRSLLTSINRLLLAGRRSGAAYRRSEDAVKKMLANMSHDIKTPLTVILGLAETAALHPALAEDERAGLLQRLYGKTQDMLALLNRYFDLARLEAGDARLPLSATDVAELCRRSLLFYHESIETAGLTAEIDIPDVAVPAWANAEAVERIVSNLLANAIRYGAGGGVVGLSVREADDHVEIAVTDRGQGVDERHQAHLFDRLYTQEDSRNRALQGSGLGLSITKRLAELMGGSVTLVSRPGVVTVFTVAIPREAPRHE